MRNFGIIVLVLGIFGYFYAGGQEGQYEPVPDGLSVQESLRYPAGRWQVARYGSAMLAGFGLLMGMFPKGR
ncbi:MAG TPA: hypothetical protein VMV21_00015 [Vicinamibacteria bacterium]|nr:hypothetical protein [Vicinamibacteria bacterium]